MFLSAQQKSLIVQTLQMNIKKTKWVMDNKELEEEKKNFLSDKINQMEEIVKILQSDAVKNYK